MLYYLFYWFLQQTFMSYYYVQRCMYFYTLHTVLPTQSKSLFIYFFFSYHFSRRRDNSFIFSFERNKMFGKILVIGLPVLLSRFFQRSGLTNRQLVFSDIVAGILETQTWMKTYSAKYLCLSGLLTLASTDMCWWKEMRDEMTGQANCVRVLPQPWPCPEEGRFPEALDLRLWLWGGEQHVCHQREWFDVGLV